MSPQGSGVCFCVCEGRIGSPCGGVAEAKLGVVWLRK